LEKPVRVTIESTHTSFSPKASTLPWQQAVARYQRSELRRSLWQMLNSIAPFFILWYLAYRSLNVSYWLTLLFAFFAALFVLRVFTSFHECGHGSLLKSQTTKDIVGSFTGILTFTPY